MKKTTKQKIERYELRELFLRSFVESIIQAYTKKEIQPEIYEEKSDSMEISEGIQLTEKTGTMEVKLEQTYQEELQPSIMAEKIQQQIIKPSSEDTEIQNRLAPISSTPIKPAFSKMPERLETKIAPIHPTYPKLPIPPPILQTNQIQLISLGKLTPFINDPLVTSIECPGPGQNIIINKGEALQTIPLTLTKKEIDELMNIISKRIKIPIATGVFKAALSNFIISAVVSEFIGTRFYIEKLRPVMSRPFPQYFPQQFTQPRRF